MEILSFRRKKRKIRSFDPTAIAQAVARSMTIDLGSSGVVRRTGVLLEPAAQFFVTEQSKSILKKFDDGNTENIEELSQRALNKFVDVNLHMRSFSYRGLNLPIYAERPCKLHGYSLRDDILITARKVCTQVLGDITTEEVFDACKHSSGSSIGVPFEDTSWERKFALPISGTFDAVKQFSSYLSWNTTMRSALFHLWGRSFSTAELSDPYNKELYLLSAWSRATTVEKNVDARRFIAVEPTLNMFFQQGLMLCFYRRLARFGLDLSTAQDLHKNLARIASLSGKQATIDWSSASDCVSTDLTEWLVPPKWFAWLDSMRTGFVNLPGHGPTPCAMFATMGNATTFPLETLVFWSIAIATVQCRIARLQNRVPVIPDYRIAQDHRVSVFGDDCIVPSEDAPLFMEVCVSVGFMVNESKSFFSPLAGFRESCGGDYYRGIDVRPFMIKAPTDSRYSSLEPWLYTILNRTLKKYKSYFGSLTYVYDMELWKTLAAIFRKHQLKVKLVPSYFPEDSGLTEHDDFVRLIPYGFELDKLLVGNFGTVGFRYLRYKYPEKTERCDNLALARCLQKGYKKFIPLKHSVDVEVSTTPRRKMGYYQVVRGTTSCWSVPSFRVVVR